MSSEDRTVASAIALCLAPKVYRVPIRASAAIQFDVVSVGTAGESAAVTDPTVSRFTWATPRRTRDHS
jgi:hypothetical protein